MRRAALVAVVVAGIASTISLQARADEPTGGGPVAGKRVGPPDIAPVTLHGLRIQSLPWGRVRGLKQNGGYIAALDPANGKELWILKIYAVTYDEAMEGDVQDVFIESMQVVKGKLLVVDEKQRRYLVDVENKSVKRL